MEGGYRQCRYYTEIQRKDGTVLERSCGQGMDMFYCSPSCAYMKPKKIGYQGNKENADEPDWF